MKKAAETHSGKAGTLYVVSTPIGNLGDLSSRAIEILQSVDAVLCEDTRTFQHLAARFGISTPRLSYHEHNERKVSEQLIERLQSGETFALVSDAGTPGISDPGYRLVSAARLAGLTISPIPGACSAIAALSVSGLPIDRFYFEGFLPMKPGARSKRLAEVLAMNVTSVILESPHRIKKFFEELTALAPKRRALLAREITKLHEEFLSGTAEEILATIAARPAVKGEIVVVIGRED